jgi:hypothetical protein
MPAIFIAGMLLFSCRNERVLSPEEALKSIKALDSDITNFIASAEEKETVRALKFLVMEPSSPLHYDNGIPGDMMKNSVTNTDPWLGNYSWMADSLKFRHEKAEEKIQITFPLEDAPGNDILLSIPWLSCHPFFTSSCFPDSLSARMTSGTEELLNVAYKAEFQDQWPSDIHLEFNSENSHGNLQVIRTRTGDIGDIAANVILQVRGHDILSGKIYYSIGYAGDQIFIRTVEPDFRIFDVSITGKLDYTKVDPASKDYVRIFNEHCNIAFKDRSSGNEIGIFGLGLDESGELLEWVIRLSDGSNASLYDHIVLFRKLMDYKYPDKP